MFSFQTVAVIMLLWMVVSVVTHLSNLDSSPNGEFEDVTNTAFSPESVVIDPPEGRSAVLDFPAIAKDWTVKFFRASTLQAPIWEDSWTQPIRIVLLTIIGAFLFVVVIKGAEIVANALPF